MSERITRVALPLRAPLTVSGCAVREWQGMLARQCDGEGQIGVGEGSTAAVARESAALDLAARRLGVRAVDLLGGARRGGVPVNALLDAVDPAACAAQAAACAARGFRSVKLKLDPADPERDRRRIAAVRAAVGAAIAIRADANGGWSAGDAIAALRPLVAYRLEYVEEPAAGAAALAAVRRALPIPIAADESARDEAAVEMIAALRAADVIVVKPSLVGVRRALAIAAAAHAHGLGVTVTSVLDGSIGIAAALHVACALAAEPRACGLATAELLARDPGRPPLLARDGWLALPEGPGLGVELDEEALTPATDVVAGLVPARHASRVPPAIRDARGHKGRDHRR